MNFNYESRIHNLKKKNPFINQTELVYELLKEDILEKFREPGSKINQDQLSESIGVSRSPIRDAMSRLINDGLVIKKSQKGYNVYIPTMLDAKRMSEFRIAIETEAGKLAVKRSNDAELKAMQINCDKMEMWDGKNIKKLVDLDIQFHKLLVECSKNDYLIHAYNQLDPMLKHLRNASFTSDIYNYMLFTHKSILTAILNKDSEAAESAIVTHLEDNVEDMIKTDFFSYN